MRIDLTCLPHAIDEMRVFVQRSRAQSQQSIVASVFGVGSEHAGAGPRRGPRWFAAIVQPDGCAASGELEGDRQAD